MRAMSAKGAARAPGGFQTCLQWQPQLPAPIAQARHLSGLLQTSASHQDGGSMACEHPQPAPHARSHPPPPCTHRLLALCSLLSSDACALQLCLHYDHTAAGTLRGAPGAMRPVKEEPARLCILRTRFSEHCYCYCLRLLLRDCAHDVSMAPLLPPPLNLRRILRAAAAGQGGGSGAGRGAGTTAHRARHAGRPEPLHTPNAAYARGRAVAGGRARARQRAASGSGRPHSRATRLRSLMCSTEPSPSTSDASGCAAGRGRGQQARWGPGHRCRKPPEPLCACRAAARPATGCLLLGPPPAAPLLSATARPSCSPRRCARRALSRLGRVCASSAPRM